MKFSIKKNDSEINPGLIWNTFIDILSTTGHDEIPEHLKPLQAVFWYDAEVQNGGHLQFFVNKRDTYNERIPKGLELLHAFSQISIFYDALKLWKSKVREDIDEVDDYISEALEGEFNNLDMEYYACNTSVTDLLQKYLDEHKDEIFISE